MPIEFRCTQCGRLLRTADDAAGKEARCPECGAVVPVPLSGLGVREPVAGGGPGSPFGAPRPGGGQAVNPYESPGPYADSGEQAATGMRPVRHVLDLGDVLRRAWDIFRERWAICLGVVLLVVVIGMAFSTACSIASMMVAAAARDRVVPIIAQVVDNLCTWLFQSWLGIGEALFLLEIVRGREPSLGLVFAGGRYFGKIIAASILVMIVAGLPLLVGMTPGIVMVLTGDPAVGGLLVILGGSWGWWARCPSG